MSFNIKNLVVVSQKVNTFFIYFNVNNDDVEIGNYFNDVWQSFKNKDIIQVINDNSINVYKVDVSNNKETTISIVSTGGGGGGSGTVNSVNNVLPDTSGNVVITSANVNDGNDTIHNKLTTLNNATTSQGQAIQTINGDITSLNVRVLSLENKGNYIGSVDNIDTQQDTQITLPFSTFSNSPSLNDFIHCVDVNVPELVYVYICTSINGTNATFTRDIKINSDLSGKVDKTTLPNVIYGTDNTSQQTTYNVNNLSGKIDTVNNIAPDSNKNVEITSSDIIDNNNKTINDVLNEKQDKTPNDNKAYYGFNGSWQELQNLNLSPTITKYNGNNSCYLEVYDFPHQLVYIFNTGNLVEATLWTSTGITIPDAKYRPPIKIQTRLPAEDSATVSGGNYAMCDFRITAEGVVQFKIRSTNIAINSTLSIVLPKQNNLNKAHVLSIGGLLKIQSYNSINLPDGSYTIKELLEVAIPSLVLGDGSVVATLTYKGTGELTIGNKTLNNGDKFTGSFLLNDTIDVVDSDGGSCLDLIATQENDSGYYVTKKNNNIVLINQSVSSNVYYYKIGTIETYKSNPHIDCCVTLTNITTARSNSSDTSNAAGSGDCFVKIFSGGGLSTRSGCMLPYLKVNGTKLDVWLRDSSNGYNFGFIWNGEVRYISERTIFSSDTNPNQWKPLTLAEILASKTTNPGTLL